VLPATFILPSPYVAHVFTLLDYQRASLQSFPPSSTQSMGKSHLSLDAELLLPKQSFERTFRVKLTDILVILVHN